MFEGAPGLANDKFANTRQFKQQLIVFEIKHDFNNPKCVIWNKVFHLQSTPRCEISPPIRSL